MWHDEKKHYLINGARMNQIIITLQMISDKFPAIGSFNRFIQNLKDMRPYTDMLDEFVCGDQKKLPDTKRSVGKGDSMTLDEMMADLELRFIKKTDEENGKN